MSTFVPPVNAPSEVGICEKFKPYRVVELTVWLVLTVYVPVPPDPVPSAVMIVSAVTPVPWMVCPTYSVPLVTAVTVKVVAVIDPVTLAATAVLFIWRLATV